MIGAPDNKQMQSSSNKTHSNIGRTVLFLWCAIIFSLLHTDYVIKKILKIFLLCTFVLVLVTVLVVVESLNFRRKSNKCTFMTVLCQWTGKVILFKVISSKCTFNDCLCSANGLESIANLSFICMSQESWSRKPREWF